MQQGPSPTGGLAVAVPTGTRKEASTWVNSAPVCLPQSSTPAWQASRFTPTCARLWPLSPRKTSSHAALALSESTEGLACCSALDADSPG